MKKLLALMGSPKVKGNTDILLDSFLEDVDKEEYEITKIDLNDLDFSPCTGCDHCGQVGDCVFEDDMMDLYDYFDNSDIIVLASPIYFNTVSSLAKKVIDRCQRYWSIKYALGQNYKRGENRRGFFLSTGGAPFYHNHFEGAIPVVDIFFRALNLDYVGNYFVSNTDNVKVEDRQDILQEIREIGSKVSSHDKFRIHR